MRATTHIVASKREKVQMTTLESHMLTALKKWGGMGRRTRMPVLFPTHKPHGHRRTAAHATHQRGIDGVVGYASTHRFSPLSSQRCLPRPTDTFNDVIDC